MDQRPIHRGGGGKGRNSPSRFILLKTRDELRTAGQPDWPLGSKTDCVLPLSARNCALASKPYSVLTLDLRGEFVLPPVLLLISSSTWSAAFALAIFLLYPDPLHFGRRPTLTSHVKSFVFESPNSSTFVKFTVSPT